MPAARHFGLGVLPFFPLANGLLTGKVRQGQEVPAHPAGRSGRVRDRREAGQGRGADRWAQEHGVTILDVAISALAAQPGCSSVIAGAMTPEQVKANAAASDWIPTPDELAELDADRPAAGRGAADRRG